MICIQIMVILGSCSCIWTVPSHKKTYTIYTEPQSWNAANMICSLRGGYLMKIESKVEDDFIFDQLDGYVTYSNPIYIGLHNAAMESDAPEYYWTDCTPQGPYPTDNIDYKPMSYCVVLYKKYSYNRWRRETCSEQNSFVCETDGGRCDYDRSNNTKGTEGVIYNATVMGDTECLQFCDEALQDGMECWGVTYYTSTSICILHLSHDSTIFDYSGIASSTVSNFYKKQCIHVHYDTTVYPTSSSINIPLTNCYNTPTTGSIYTIFERAVTWQEAKEVCSHIGASLVEYRNNKDVLDVRNIAVSKMSGISTFWVGLKRYTNMTFLWQDGTDVTSYTTWQSQPSNNSGTCVRANQNLHWIQDNCTNSHSFVCEQPGVCGYEVLPNTIGNGAKLNLKLYDQCMEVCDDDATCIAFSSILINCYTNHQSDIYYFFNSSNYQTSSLSTFNRYSCSHALRMGNVSVEIPNLYFPTGINLTGSVLMSSSELVLESTSLMEDSTSSFSELSEVSMEISSFTGSIDEEAESSTETVFSTVDFTNEMTTIELTTTHSSLATIYYTEMSTEFTETIGDFISTDSLDNLDPSTNVISSSDACGDSVTPSLILSEITVMDDISSEIVESISESVTSDISNHDFIATSTVSVSTSADIGNTIESSFTTVVHDHNDKSVVTNTLSLQSIPHTEFTTLYPPKQSHYIPMCPCRCVSRRTSSENIGDRIQKLVNDLVLDKRNLSSTLHTLYSIEDDRPSAQTLGYSSIILLVCVFLFFLIMDISHFMMPKQVVAKK